MTKKSWGIVFVLLALLGVFTFFDLQISQAVFNIHSGFGHIFDCWGENISTLIAAFSAAVLFAMRKRDNWHRGVLAIIFYGVLVLFNSLMFAFIPLARMKEMDLEQVSMPAVGIIAIGLVVALMIIAHKMKPNRHWKRFAYIGLYLSLAAMVVINIIKPIWGRVRFREMSAPFDMFSPWYLPQFGKWSELFVDPASFPSGHTANAAVIIVIVLLPTVIAGLKGKKPLLWGIALVYTALVAFSRIVMGAHFASDVTMSVIIMMGLFALIQKVVNKSMHYNPQNNTFQ